MNYPPKMCPRFKQIPKLTSKIRQRQAVCRNLFGPINHRMTERFLTKELDQILVTCTKDWDFDFSCEAPLNGGRFSWEPSRPQSCPNRDQRQATAHNQSFDSVTGPENLDNGSDRDSSPIQCSKEISRPCRTRSRTRRMKMVTFKTDPELSSTKSFKQPTIKDYLPIRKRRTTKWKEPVTRKRLTVRRPKSSCDRRRRDAQRSNCELRSAGKRRSKLLK